VPGAKIEDVELSIENGMLGVKVTRNKMIEKDIGVQHRVERFVGEWRRMVKIPKNADFNQAAAKLNDGVLIITLPKFEEEVSSTKRMVPINR
jgi:HSP20 family protein